jgi:methionyl-tRNA formyltransferase
MDPGARTVLFATGARFSRMVLERLLARGVPLVGLVAAGQVACSPIPVQVQPRRGSAAALATSRGIPILAVPGCGDPGLEPFLRRLEPDFILVACFPYWLSRVLRTLPRIACLNLHPSLLPRHRGPTPLFWQFRGGERHLGISLHLVGERIDAGNIVLQEAIRWDDGLTGPQADTLLAARGADLFLRALDLSGSGGLRSEPQDEALASYERGPRPEDFRIPDTWTARRAFNFVRGTGHWRQPYEVAAGERRLMVQAVEDFTATGDLGTTFRTDPDGLRIQFSPGILHAWPAPTTSTS